MNRLVVWECVGCGRLWVTQRTHTNHVILQSDECDMVNNQATHAGACHPDDPTSWAARCDSQVVEVYHWPALRAAYKLGGREGAQACVRPKEARGTAQRNPDDRVLNLVYVSHGTRK